MKLDGMAEAFVELQTQDAAADLSHAEWLTATQRRDMMEIVEERYGSASTVITSQLPVDAWHDVIDEPTFADAILDRIVHNAHRLSLDGHSMRKTHDAPKSIDGDAND